MLGKTPLSVSLLQQSCLAISSCLNLPLPATISRLSSFFKNLGVADVGLMCDSRDYVLESCYQEFRKRLVEYRIPVICLEFPKGCAMHWKKEIAIWCRWCLTSKLLCSCCDNSSRTGLSCSNHALLRQQTRRSDVKKIKGRGVLHESGLRSWNDTLEKKNDQKIEAEAEPKVQPLHKRSWLFDPIEKKTTWAWNKEEIQNTSMDPWQIW